MRIHLSGRAIPEVFFRALAMVTDGGLLRSRDIWHDERERLLGFSLRYRTKHFKRGFFGTRVTADPEVQNLKVVIGHVVDYTILNDCEKYGVPEICLFMGVQVRQDEVSFDSAEEDAGKHLLSVRAKLAEIDIEISDGGDQQ